MSEEQLPTYTVGDEVELSITIRHRMHLKSVFAVWFHEDGRTRLVLADQHGAAPDDRGGGDTRTECSPRAILGPEMRPGVYTLDRLELVTKGEKRVPFPIPDEEHIPPHIAQSSWRVSIRVVEEPADPPYIEDVQLVSY